MPELIEFLTMPVTQCKKDHGTSGAELELTLRDSASNIMSEPKLMAMGKNTARPAGGADRERKYTGPAKGVICYSKRETGTCKVRNCLGKHDIAIPTDFCTNPEYLKHGVCLSFRSCTKKHKLLPLPEMRAARKKAMNEAAGIGCSAIPLAMGTTESQSSEVDTINILEGDRVRRPSIDHVSEAYLPFLIETEEERAIILDEDISDKLVTHSSGCTDYDSDKDSHHSNDSWDEYLKAMEDPWSPETIEDESEVEVTEMYAALAINNDDNTAVELEALYERLDSLYERVAATAGTSTAHKLLIDGGTFAHLFGTGIKHLLTNQRKVKAVPVLTAGNVIYLDEMADLILGQHQILDGYVNPHAELTLISEGTLLPFLWEFHSDLQGKQCSSPAGEFMAMQEGPLFFWPCDGAGELIISPELSMLFAIELPGLNTDQELAEELYELDIAAASTTDKPGKNPEPDKPGKNPESDMAADSSTELAAPDTATDPSKMGTDVDPVLPAAQSPTLLDIEEAHLNISPDSNIAAPNGGEYVEEAMPEFMDTPTGDDIYEEADRYANAMLPKYKHYHRHTDLTDDELKKMAAVAYVAQSRKVKMPHDADSYAAAVTTRGKAAMEGSAEADARKVSEAHEAKLTATTDAAIAKAISDHERDGHTTRLPAKYGVCEDCEQAYAIDKAARKRHSPDTDTEGIVNLDTLDMLHKDADGNRYMLDGVVLEPRLGLAKGEPNKSSRVTAQTWKGMKHELESKTDPGGKLGYKVTEVRHDPGSEFEGAMKEEIQAN